MSAFLLLSLFLLLGVFVARIAKPPPGLAGGLNWWVLYVALPATVLQLTPRLSLTFDMWFLIVSMWLLFAGAWAVFATVGKLLHWPRSRVGALTLVCGLGNTSFIGYPMIEALRGAEGLKLAAVADQAGCFVMFAVGGAIVTSLNSGASVRAGDIAKRVFFFPAFIALLVGLGAGMIGGWPPMLATMLERLSVTLVPLALFSVGLQVRLEFSRDQFGAAALGLAYKLALAPLAVYALGIAANVGGLTLTVGTLQAAMAPMISAAILAEQHNLEPRLANLTLTVGIALSFLTVPLVNSWL